MSEIMAGQLMGRPDVATVVRAKLNGLLHLNDLLLLQLLREFVVDPDEPNVMVSVRELEAITKGLGLMSKSQIETSMKRLVEAGMVIREQRDKRNREIAVTTLLPSAFHVMEAASQTQASVLPPVLRGLLAGEAGSVIAAVQRAWEQSEMPELGVSTQYRGGGEGWERIESLLRGRVEERVMALEAAVDEQERREEQRHRGVHQITVAGGTTVEIDARTIERDAPAACDVAIAVEVLTIAEQARPGTITEDNVHVRLAEALYSRHIGFASRMDAARAVQVLGRQMAKETWGRPFSIRDSWYAVCAGAVQPLQTSGYAQVS